MAIIATVVGFIAMPRCAVLFKNGKSDYVIVLCSDASVSEQKSAEELCAYLEQIAGVNFARQHNIRLNEWTTVEEFIGLYNKLMNGEITIEQITDFITKRWIEQAG